MLSLNRNLFTELWKEILMRFLKMFSSRNATAINRLKIYNGNINVLDFAQGILVK
jgi:hypothetical protein